MDSIGAMLNPIGKMAKTHNKNEFCIVLLERANGYNGNCISFNGNYNGVYWYVMDSIGAMLNPIGKMAKTHNKNEFCIVLLERANGYNGNCIGFNGNYNGVYWYVMDSIGGMLNPIGKMSKTHYK